MNYLDFLEHSFNVEKDNECAPGSRLEFLSRHVFDFTTYDSDMDELFASKAVDVCRAINNGSTFEFIQDPENYKWFLLMCNMPFFAARIEWGSSIRGAWWSAKSGKSIKLESCGLWIGFDQVLTPMLFSYDEWQLFIKAMIVFAIEP